VTVVSACSGHDFKHSAALGEAIAEQIADGGSRIPLDAFALSHLG
jgi:glycine/D-amino acid oxidase-like deaminating enzyme